jgi:hypothetical protein
MHLSGIQSIGNQLDRLHAYIASLNSGRTSRTVFRVVSENGAQKLGNRKNRLVMADLFEDVLPSSAQNPAASCAISFATQRAYVIPSLDFSAFIEASSQREL